MGLSFRVMARTGLAAALLLLAGPLGAEMLAVKARRVNVRDEPRMRSAVLRRDPRGTVYEAIGRYGPWRQVRSLDGLEGWIHERMLAKAPEARKKDAPLWPPRPDLEEYPMYLPEKSNWPRRYGSSSAEFYGMVEERDDVGRALKEFGRVFLKMITPPS